MSMSASVHDRAKHTAILRQRPAYLLVLAVGTALLWVLPTPAEAYVIRSTDTLSEIANRNGVSTSSLAAANGIVDHDRIIEGQTIEIPGTSAGGGSAAGRHVVAPGETLSQIASRYGVSTRSLAAANGISNPDRVRSGHTLSVAGAGSSSAAAPAQPSSNSSARALITAAAARHGWNPAIPLGLAMQESGWNNNVVSSAGARGIMQVMPSTGEWVGRVLLERPVDLNNPADNTAVGVAYLDHLYNLFDRDLVRTLAAYYEGQGNVRRDGPSANGRRYAANVMALADRYR